MRYRSSRVVLAGVAALGFLLGCGDDDGGGGGDWTPPTFASIAVSPDPAKAGDTLTITFTASEPLAGNPTVTVDGNAATFVSAVGLDYIYTYVVLGTETDGTVAISVSGSDAAANAGVGAGSVTLDVPPRFSIAAVPDPAKAGDTLTITFTASEPLAANPTATVDGNAAAFVSAAGLDYTYSYVVAGTETEGAAAIAVAGDDVTGNPGSGSGSVVLDFTAPVVAVDALWRWDSTPELTGTVDDAAAAMSVTVDGQVNAAANNGDGTWTLADDTLTVLVPGTYDVAATATDAAGNVGTDATTNELTITGFTDIGAGLMAVNYCSLAWGDYDSDGDLDLALAGYDDSNFVSKVYRNDGGGTFTDIAAGLVGVGHYACALAWGDYDNDGDLDLALAGATSSTFPHDPISKVYRNDGGGTFTDIAAGMTGVERCALAWGDCDNDGDLDLALAGYTDSSPWRISKVYRNDGGGTFTDIAAALTGVGIHCSLAWGDYDNDGDLDLALAGESYYDGAFHWESKVYRNDGGGTFTDIAAGLTGVSGKLAWGDYDNDGDLDLALAGYRYDGALNYESRIYRNDGGTFTDIGAGLTGVGRPSLAWGDYDNDGDLDLALAGYWYDGTTSHYESKVYRNDGGTFSEIGAGLPGVGGCSLTWGDYDNDGDLDLALAGDSGTGYISKVYRNDGGVFNTAPAAPAGLGATYTGPGPYDVTFSWAAPAVADETPEDGLSYNLRVGTTPGGSEVFSGMAQADGWRKLPARGVAQPGLSVTEWTLTLPADTYYWSVQAVDTAFAASAWPAEEVLDVVP